MPGSSKLCGALLGAALVAGASVALLLTGACDRKAAAAAADGPPPAPAQYAGAQACVACHEREASAWRGSQHALAMQEASDKTVLGDFANTSFTNEGVTSTFFRKDGGFFVRTDGPDGQLADFQVKYTFGLEPLQQYLLAFPGGRLQALGIAWDSRKKADGGQRWFYLYPNEKPKPGHPLHWTGIDQNWNHECADCHSTNLRKNYDEHTDTFATTWSDLNVACEACHGPGSRHVAWAAKDVDGRRLDPTRGLAAALDERHGVSWVIQPNGVSALRSTSRDSSRELETCARCHARRSQFSDDVAGGQPFHDGFRPAMIAEPLYHVDGQQRDEVYDYGSFLLSKMNARGVTCSDCHEPHGGKLRKDGNGVCSQCHKPEAFDTTAHHHHPMGSPGASCAACHMPTTTYMLIDPRHDHSFRVPRPEASAKLGAPDACTSCHKDRPAGWVTDAMRRWYPQPRPDPLGFAEAFRAGRTGEPGAREKLLDVVRDVERPPFARAGALAMLAPLASPAVLKQAAFSLGDRSADVRVAAVLVLETADPDTRLAILPHVLRDPSRIVRMDAARSLAELESRLPPEARDDWNRAIAEYVAAQRFNANRPEGLASLAGLERVRGRFDEALAAGRRAVALDPTFVQAAVNLADCLRELRRDPEAEQVLRAALAKNSTSGPVMHALGLTLVRQKKMKEALDALGSAVRATPDVARFAYVYGVALHDTGDRVRALEVLRTSLARHPFDPDILSTLGTYEQEAGLSQPAAQRLKVLRQLEADGE